MREVGKRHDLLRLIRRGRVGLSLLKLAPPDGLFDPLSGPKAKVRV